MKDVCNLCGEKLKKKENDAIFYCIKCEEQKIIKKNLKDKLAGN
jgi:predicted RNA-binding Zn-ribbon protein involved in translation (DUF1610 family)